jgi:alkylation response protein AidB-like acyl-CoA dehydrogenase
MNAAYLSPWMDEDLSIFRDAVARFVNEYLVCRRMFADARVQRIYGGTSEIIKELISCAF